MRFPLYLILVAGLFSLNALATPTLDATVPAEVRAQAEQDLIFLSSIRGEGASPLHREVFGMVDGAVYTAWLNTRITTISYTDKNASGAVAFVDALHEPQKLVLTQNYRLQDHPQIGRILPLLHEARHSEVENGAWMHVLCPTPYLDDNGQDIKSLWTGIPLAGKKGCDDTAVGAYGVAGIFGKNIAAFCVNCSEKVKMDASLYADDQIIRVAVEPAKQILRTDVTAK